MKLESSKIKDRNDALTSLEEMVESNHSFSNKDLSSVCEALFAFIENEKVAYSKNQAVAAESRLQSSSYMLRRLVVQHAKQMKFKLVKQLLNFCKEIIFGYENEIVKPLALDISKILNILVSIDQHRDHISSEDWVRQMDAILKVLNEQIKHNMTEKFVSELLGALKVLVVNPLIAIEDLGFDLSDFLVKYFKTMKKESSLTSVVLDITNNLIITLSTSKVRYSIKLVKSVLKIAGSLVNTNYEALREQILIFGLLSSDFICENLPKLIEVENSQGPSFDDDDGLRDDLIFWIDQWIQHVLRTPTDILSLQHIEFLNSKTENSWFNFGPIRLEKSSPPKPWLSTLALTKLVNSLYYLKRPLVKNPEGPAKRQKLGSESYVTTIDTSESPFQLFHRFIQSTDVSMQKLGLQLLTFYVYNYKPVLTAVVFDEIKSYHDKPELAGFTSLLTKALIEAGWELDNTELSQLLRINLQLLKDRNLVNVASQTIIQVLNYPKYTVGENSLYLQMQSVFEISEINGPASVTNDSLRFWVAFSQHGKGFKSANKKVGDRIVDWLLTKWDRESVVEVSSFPYFISWLAGTDFTSEDDEVIYENIFNTFCAKWGQKSSLAKFILRSDSPVPINVSSQKLQKPKIMIKVDSLTPVIDQLLLDMESFDAKSKGYELLRLVRYGFLIYQNIQTLSRLESTVERLKYDIRRFLENLEIDKFDDYNDAVFQISEFKVVNGSGAFIFESLDAQEIAFNALSNHEKLHESMITGGNGPDSSIIMSDFGDFGQVRKETKDSYFQASTTYLDLELYSTFGQKVFKLLILLNSQFSSSKNLNTTLDQALRVLEKLDHNAFSSGLFTLLEYLEKVDVMKIQTVSISKLLRLLGHKLLSSYQTERSPTTIILASRLFTVFTKAWLLKITEKWAVDYSDMFKWIVSLAEKGLIAEEVSLYYFLESIFAKLGFEMDSASLDVAISLFHKCSNLNKVKLCEGIKKFIVILPPSEQTKCLEAIYSGFINPQVLDDSAATYTYCIGQLITVSYPLFIGGISQLLLNYGYLHFAPYIESLFLEIDLDILEQKFILLELLKFWYENRSDLTTFPAQLFGLENQQEFYDTYKGLIYPILISHKGTPSQLILNNGIMGMPIDESDLLLETLSLSIPLSYTKNGRRSELLKIINETYDYSLIEHQTLLIVEKFMECCDFSKESDFEKYIGSIEKDQTLSLLFNHSSSVDNENSSYSRVNISVPFSVVIHQITQITASSADFWTPAAVLYLSRNVIKSLSSAISEGGRFVLLRRLKLIITLGFQGFQNQDVAFAVIEFLYPYISDSSIHIDVCSILVVLLKLSKKAVTNTEHYFAVLLMVLHESVRYKIKGSSLFHLLESYLIEENAGIDFKGIWKMLFLPLTHILTQDSSSLEGSLIMDYDSQANLEYPRSEYIIIHDILKYGAIEESQKMKKLIFNVLSDIFNKVPFLNEIDWRIKTARDVAILLLDFKDGESKEFNLFKARYLGRHYLLTGETLSDLEREIPVTIEYDLDLKTETLFGIFDELLKIRKASEDLKEIQLIDSVFGVAFFEHNRGALKDSPLVSFDQHLKDQVKVLPALDLFTFKLISGNHPAFYSWAQLAKDSEVDVKPTGIWCRDVTLGLLGTFVDHSPIIPALMTYVYRFPEISKSLIFEVLLFYIRCGRSAAEKLALNFINGIIEREDVYQLSNEKIEIIVKICYFLRINRDDIKPFNNVFRNLDLERLFKLTCHIGLSKVALLFFELHYTDLSSNKAVKWTDDTKTLRKIYNNFDDADLLHGLPVDPTLGYAMDSFSRGNDSDWKSVIFNSANLDSSIALKEYSNFDVSASRNMMLRSLVGNSLHGVSELLNDTMDPQKRLRNSYEWCWKLNQWDLPVPESPSTENEAIYKALKTIYDNNKKGQAICNSLLVDSLEVNGKVKSLPLFKTLSSLYSIEIVQSLNSFTIFEEAGNFTDCTEAWFPLVSFAEIENIMLSRRSSYGICVLSGKIGVSDGLVAEILEMKRYGYYARLHGEVQRATNASMWIDKRIQVVSEEDLKRYLTKISNFESACTLWNQGEAAISIAMLKDNLSKQYPTPPEITLASLEIHDSVLNAHLVKWTSESRQEKFETIMQTYVKASLKDIEKVSSAREKAGVYHILGYFCYKQTKLPGAGEEIERQEMRLKSKQAELKDLKVIIQNKSTPADEKKNAKRYFQRVQLQYESDKEAYNILCGNKSTCIEKALEFFMKAASIDDFYDDEDIDKICALWLEYSDDDSINKITRKEISSISSHKFIPWINQLMSRLSDDSTPFQHILLNILVAICLRHPFHSLYFVMNLRVHKLYQFARTDATINSRSAAAEKLWLSLTSQGENFARTVMKPIDTLSRNALSLATEKVPNNNVRKMNLENLKIGDFWINQVGDLRIPLPTINQLKISLDGNYSSVPRIISVDPVIQISSSGISLPKIMKVFLTDGSRHKMLLKGSSDDLRQDAIMEQVFEKVNTILRNDKETRKRDLKIRTYKVVPLGPQAGMIEFVANSIALSDILRPLHSEDSISFSEAREMMRGAQSLNNKERLNVYLKIAKATPPVFRVFFYDTFPNIDEWYRSRQVYTRGIATNSIVGFILGLGDRHLNNVLIDKRTGEPIHIDLGVAFDQGKLLPVPELVPFRLTRDIVDGLGITGVEGSFKKGSEHVYRVLRLNVEKILGILNVLKYDPLYSWAISPVRKKRLQEIENDNVSSKSNVEDDGSDAVRAVQGVEAKLNANGLSDEASVQELIQEATDYKNLGVIYLGWTPFY